MTFAHPLMLLGMLSAAIPLLVHLFDRRRPRVVPFGALSFVLKSEKRTASRLKLKRLLLYLLRTLILLLIPLALARPEFSRDGQAATARGAAATVVVLDASLAMRWSAGTSLFDEGKAQAKAALKELLTEEPASVMVCTRTANAPAPLAFDRPRMLALIDDAQPTWEVVDLNRCLDTAAHVMDESPLQSRRLILVSALTQNALHLETAPPVSTGPKGEKLKPELVLRDVAANQKSLPNRAIVEVKSEAAVSQGPRVWQFTATVRNFSDEAVHDVELQLKVGGEVVTKGFVDVQANGTAQKTLTHRFKTGGVLAVELTLSHDALADDDSRVVVVTVPADLKALVVNGSPNTQKYRDEAFFTEAALSAAGSPVRPVVRDTEAAWREDFTKFDAVFLLNVEAPTAEVSHRLREFVQNGGGLFISMGDRVDTEKFNIQLEPVLPKKFRVVKTAVEPGSADVATRSAKLAAFSQTHPVMAPFTGKAAEGLTGIRFFRYVLFESEGGLSNSEVLGSLDDGAPAFMAARVGTGRVLMFASSVDRDWSDFPIRTGFLPFMQRAAAWLTGTLDEHEDVKAFVGQSVTVRPSLGTIARVVSPSGREVAVTANGASSERTVGPLPEPGRYAVFEPGGTEVNALAFSASIDPAASDTSRHPLEALSAWAGEDAVKAAGPAGSDAKTPVWTWLLLTAALAFVLEGILLRR